MNNSEAHIIIKMISVHVASSQNSADAAMQGQSESAAVRSRISSLMKQLAQTGIDKDHAAANKVQLCALSTFEIEKVTAEMLMTALMCPDICKQVMDGHSA